MTPLQILLIRAPCYKDSADIRGLLTLAESQVGPDFGPQRNTAVALLALHTLALQSRGRTSVSGAITAESEGDLSRSYATPPITKSEADAWYSLTAWGLEFLSLRSSSGPTFLNRRFGACG